MAGIFSLNFENLLTLDLESLEIKESDTVSEVYNTTNRGSERATFKKADVIRTLYIDSPC